MNYRITQFFKLTLFVLTFAAVVGSESSDSEIIDTTDRDIELGPETADKVICSRLAFLRICLAVAFTFLITIAIFLVQAVKKKQEDHSHAQIGPDAYLFKEKIRHKEFKFVKKLGSGAYGQVYAAVNNRDGGLFAVKSTWLKGKNINAFKNTQREIDLLSKLEHENIVRYLGSHQDSEHFYMYMELVAGGSLEDFLTSEADSRKQLSPSVAQSYSKQILTGLAYLHENGVIHRDLKPGNALVTIGGKMKLADFGASFDMTNLEHSTKQTTIGTVHYMAPEVVVNGAHTTASDIWSLGVMVFEMLTGRLPFKSKTHHQLLVDLARGDTKVEWPFDVLSLPAHFTHFIQACLNHDPEKRPSAKQLLEHPFICQKINSPSGSQQFNPKYMHDEDDISLDQLSEQSSASCQPVNLIKQISEDFNEQGQVIKLKKEVADKNDKNFKTVAVQILRENWLLTSIALLMLATFVILSVVVVATPEQEIKFQAVPEEQTTEAQTIPADDPRLQTGYNPPTYVVFGRKLYGYNIIGGVLLGTLCSGIGLWCLDQHTQETTTGNRAGDGPPTRGWYTDMVPYLGWIDWKTALWSVGCFGVSQWTYRKVLSLLSPGNTQTPRGVGTPGANGPPTPASAGRGLKPRTDNPPRNVARYLEDKPTAPKEPPNDEVELPIPALQRSESEKQELSELMSRVMGANRKIKKNILSFLEKQEPPPSPDGPAPLGDEPVSEIERAASISSPEETEPPADAARRRAASREQLLSSTPLNLKRRSTA